MNRLFSILFFLLLSFRISAMTNTEAIQYVNRYYDLLNQYAVVKNDAPGLARQITSLHVENAGSIYPDIEVKLGGLPDTKGVVISTYLTSISDPERKRSMLLKFVPRDIIIKSNSGGVTCVLYTLYVYDDNATPNTSVLKYSIPLEMRINQYYKIKSITKSNSVQTTTLSVSPTSLSFGASGGTRTITVSSNKDWSISVGTVSWGHLTRSANTLTLKVDANNTGESRSDYFKIKAGDKEQKVIITQGKQEENDAPSAKINRVWTEEDVYEDGIRGLRIHLNMNAYNLKSKQCRATAYFQTSSGTALIDTNNKYHTNNGKVSCGRNFTPGYDNSLYEDFAIFMPYDELHTSTNGSYQFDIVLWNKSVSPSKEITRHDGVKFVYSAPQITNLSVFPTSLSFGASGGTRTITVSSNKDWSISVGTASWGHLTRGGNTLTLRVDANTGSERSDFFKIKAGDKEQKISISQEASTNVNIENVWVDHNVPYTGYRNWWNGFYWQQVPYNYNVMRIHVKFSVNGRKGERLRVCAFFFHEDGKNLKGTGEFSTPDGQATVQVVATPTYENSQYDDFILNIPYETMKPKGKRKMKFYIQIQDQSGNSIATSSYEYFTLN